jgi:hypothetical protein
MDKSILSPEAQQRLSFSRMMLGVHTAIPGIVTAWNATSNLATVQPAIRMQIIRPDGAIDYLDLPAVENVPACLPRSTAGGLLLTVPIKPGDACLLIFSQRAIDHFVQHGGIQNPLTSDRPDLCEMRHHDLSDAIMIPGLWSIPDKVANWADDALELRNDAGTVKLSIKSDGVYVTGNLKVTGTVVAGAANVSLTTHHHSDPQGGDTGGPA